LQITLTLVRDVHRIFTKFANLSPVWWFRVGTSSTAIRKCIFISLNRIKPRSNSTRINLVPRLFALTLLLRWSKESSPRERGKSLGTRLDIQVQLCN
jgi:hypothetical protein